MHFFNVKERIEFDLTYFDLFIGMMKVFVLIIKTIINATYLLAKPKSLDEDDD